MDQEVLRPRRKASKASVWKSKKKGGRGGQCLIQERPSGRNWTIRWIHPLAGDG